MRVIASSSGMMRFASDEPKGGARRFAWGRLASRILSWALGLAVVLASSGGAQNPPQAGAQQSIGSLAMQRSYGTAAPFGDYDPIQEEKRLRLLNAERQKEMVSDAGKLLKLAGELQAVVEKSNSEALAPAELRKLAEIEKLAHKVKDKMSFSVGSEPTFRDMPRPPDAIR